jgi:hypothetical protein
MRRRDFVALGSAALASSVLLEKRAWAADADGTLAAPTLLPIGYWDGSDGPNVIPAASLPSGDVRLLGKRVGLTVLGVFSDVRSLSFRVVFSGEQPVEFAAWTFNWRGGAPNPSPSVRLRVPVLSPDGLSFLGEFARTRAGTRQAFRAQLSLGSDAGQPKLRRGVYAVALPGRVLPGPVWRRYQLAWAGPSDPGPLIQLLRQRAPEEAIPADFGYLLLLVDTPGRRSLRPLSQLRA